MTRSLTKVMQTVCQHVCQPWQGDTLSVNLSVQYSLRSQHSIRYYFASRKVGPSALAPWCYLKSRPSALRRSTTCLIGAAQQCSTKKMIFCLALCSPCITLLTAKIGCVMT